MTDKTGFNLHNFIFNYFTVQLFRDKKCKLLSNSFYTDLLPYIERFPYQDGKVWLCSLKVVIEYQRKKTAFYQSFNKNI